MMMNPEVKELWLEALKEYPQTRGRLRDETGFCCLGVLCDVYAKTELKGEWKEHDDDASSLLFSAGAEQFGAVLPCVVADWAGLRIMPHVRFGGYSEAIAVLNDGSFIANIEPMNFAQISEIIKEQL